jgi:hypothetical protein
LLVAYSTFNLAGKRLGLLALRAEDEAIAMTDGTKQEISAALHASK